MICVHVVVAYVVVAHVIGVMELRSGVVWLSGSGWPGLVDLVWFVGFGCVWFRFAEGVCSHCILQSFYAPWVGR